MMKLILTYAIVFWSFFGFGQEVKLGLPMGHQSGIFNYELSSDGDLLLTCGRLTNQAFLWDTKSGKLLREYKIYNKPRQTNINRVNELTDYNMRIAKLISNDEQLILISESNSLQIYDIKRDTLIYEFKDLNGFQKFLISNDEEYIATEFVNENDELYLNRWQLVKGAKPYLKEINSIESWHISSVNPNYYDGVIEVFENNLEKVEKKVTGIKSPDGKLISVLSNADDLNIYNLSTQTILSKIKWRVDFPSFIEINWMTFSDDNKTLFIGTHLGVKSYDVLNGRGINYFRGSTGFGQNLTLVNGGKTLLNTIQVDQDTTFIEKAIFTTFANGSLTTILDFGFSLNPNNIVTNKKGNYFLNSLGVNTQNFKLKIWNVVDSPKLIKEFSGSATDFNFVEISPNEKYFSVPIQNKVQVYRISDCKFLKEIECKRNLAEFNGMNDEFLTVEDSNIIVWNIDPFMVKTKLISEHKESITKMFISEDGQRFFTVDMMNTLIIRDAKTYNVIKKLVLPDVDVIIWRICSNNSWTTW
jgi:WD40 repeat protein